MVASQFDIPRDKQDHYALISHTRAEEVIDTHSQI